MYVRSKTSRKCNSSLKNKDPLSQIDEIDQFLVAQCLVDELYKETKSIKLCFGMIKTVRWIYSRGRLDDLRMMKTAEQQILAAAKGVPFGVPPPTSLVSAAIRKIAHKCHLFHWLPYSPPLTQALSL